MGRILKMTAGLLGNTVNKADATDIVKILKTAAKLIENIGPRTTKRPERIP